MNCSQIKSGKWYGYCRDKTDENRSKATPWLFCLPIKMNLRKHYQPLQPILEPGSPMTYQEYVPSEGLQPLIHCFWTLKSESDSSSTAHYRIVSDGCIDLFIDCNDFQPILIAGTANTSQEALFPGKTQYFGIRFYPGCLQYFFNMPIREITNNMIPFQDVWNSRLHSIEEKLFEAGSTAYRIQLAEEFLLEQLANREKAPDERFLGVLQQILKKNGTLQIEKDLHPGVSPRQLRRYFDYYIGFNPKTFSRIIRFQKTLKAMMSQPKEQWGKLCYDFGYYDQAHYIHEFKELSGLSPSSVAFSMTFNPKENAYNNH